MLCTQRPHRGLISPRRCKPRSLFREHGSLRLGLPTCVHANRHDMNMDEPAHDRHDKHDVHDMHARS